MSHTVQLDQYYLVLRQLNVRTSVFLVILCTIAFLQQYNCKQLRVVETYSRDINISDYVPILKSDIPLFRNANLTITKSGPALLNTNDKTQVPFVNGKIQNLSNNGSSAGQQHYQQQQQRSANYSVISLVKNIDARLRNIRNIELGITKIQEIFDAIDYTTTVSETNETLFRYSNRLSKKLQKATKSILDLRKFFDRNITNILLSTFESKFEGTSTVSVAMTTATATATSSNISEQFLNTLIEPCPFEDFGLEQNYNKQQIQILNYLKNNNFQNENSASFSINGKILEEIRRLNVDSNNFKHIFYLSHDDYASDHNCQYYFNDLHFRRLYASVIQGKHIFILIDVGSVLSAEQLELSKTFVSNIIKMLSDTDFISIVTLSNDAIPMNLIEAPLTVRNLSGGFSFMATPDNKEDILEFISGLKRSTELTNHSLGFEYAFSLLRQQNLAESDALEFIYVTRGLLTRLSDAKSVLSVIAMGQRSLPFPIVINTCAVILDEKRIMYEKQFLNDIVQQNFTKYEIDVKDWYRTHHNLTGNLYIITKRHPERIIKTSTAVFTNLFRRCKHKIENLKVHHPVVDYNSKDVIVSITHPVAKFGLVGVSLYLSDIAEDVINYKNSPESYACLIDAKGVAIIHPALQRLSYLTTSLPVDIAYLENSTDFLNVRTLMLKEEIGNITVTSDLNQNTTKIYSWHRVMDMYVVCIVTVVKSYGRASVPPYQARFGNSLNKFQHTEHMPPIDLLYHRIDLIPPPTPACRYFRQIATFDAGTLYLSASSFQSPFTYMKNNRNNCDGTKIRTVQSIMAYIKDNTGLLANPGLLPRIRNDVSVLYSVMEHLKKRHLENNELKNYIIRRYAATLSGVLQVYPGCILGADLDPSRRPWFRKAMQHPGRIVVTEPYLDAGGAGYIVTIAHTIFEGKANALHSSERDTPVAIIALDVPYAFFYKIVLDSALCQEENIKCILFENEGYLIAHPSMMEPSSASKNVRRPYEHLTHKESFLANDILNHKTLVKKLACANYQNRTVERFYEFNTSLTGVLNNVVHGERTKYQIAAIWGTNIFAAVLNSTCNGGAFCPCSTVDRTCLNCNRMDQTDCECPCECPMHLKDSLSMTSMRDKNELLNVYRSYALRYAYCEPPSDSFMIDNSYSYDWNMVLNSCLHINCDLFVTHTDCLAVMGCEWCQLDLDGNPFSASFCTTQNSCFNGVLSSISPYGDGEIGPVILEPPKQQLYSALGPVGGAIIVLCLVIGFAMYCYRQSLDSSGDQFYIVSMHEDNYGVPLSRFNFDNIPPPDDGDIDSLGDGHGAMHHSLHPIENALAVSDVSPYHMSTGSSYRRPPNGESDHGYSTMTPHEDSEHMCFTLAEPLINNKRLSKSDSLSISTSVSSPTNHNNAFAVDRPVSSMGIRIRSNDNRYTTPKNNSMCGQTVLGDCKKESDDQQQMSPHHILARVTVHRHMEAL